MGFFLITYESNKFLHVQYCTYVRQAYQTLKNDWQK